MSDTIEPFETFMKSAGRYEHSLREEWKPTPYMVNYDFGDDMNDVCLMRSLYQRYGNQSSPMHKKAGLWKRGAVTIFGKSWLGFATQKLLDDWLSNTTL